MGDVTEASQNVEGTLVISAGTIAAGTLQLNPKTSRNILSYGTSGTNAIGTLIGASGVGTYSWVSSLSLGVCSGTAEIVVSWGTQLTGTAVLERGVFVAGGGVSKDYTYAVNAGVSNSPLTWNIISGAGTISYSVKYWNE